MSDFTGLQSDLPLLRIIIPAYPRENIFTDVARGTTALGPIMVATSASHVPGFRVEVIDENNWHAERGKDGKIDHAALQKARPATIVGIYIGLSSTAPRAYEIARFYNGQAVPVIAGGWHAHYEWEEALSSGIAIVIHGDGEFAVQRILENFKRRAPLHHEVIGASYKCGAEFLHHKPAPEEMLAVSDLERLPYPNFGLLRNAKIRIYPIGMKRGCSRNCEFCSVRGEVRSSSAEHFFRTVEYLVETRDARQFFIVDDRLEENIEETIRFFNMVAERYGNRLIFTAQIRAEAAKNIRFLEAMKRAGVVYVCVGCESPIDEELHAMNKGYRAEHMVEWIRIISGYFRIHKMLIFSYPLLPNSGTVRISTEERFKRFVRFIRKTKGGSVQVLIAVPLPGTGLRFRLQSENRVFPLDIAPWDRYDGTFITFKPDEGMTAKEVQVFTLRLMSWYYNPWRIVNIVAGIVFPIGLLRGWRSWYESWMRDVVRYGGSRIVGGWKKSGDMADYLKKIES